MDKKYKADNGSINLWGIVLFLLLGLFIFRFEHIQNLWAALFYLVFTIILVLSVTIREYAVTELNFLEIRCVLRLFSKNRRIAIGDIVGLQKVKKNKLRIDKVRGFEVLKVKESDMDALIAELKERNPRIRVAGEEE